MTSRGLAKLHSNEKAAADRKLAAVLPMRWSSRNDPDALFALNIDQICLLPASQSKMKFEI